jgi:inosose dehydratase
MMRIANAPCSWGVLEFDGMESSAPCAQVLDEIAATGYNGTELGDWGFMPTDPPTLSAELATRKLAMLGAFVPVRLADESAHAAGIEVAVRTARLLAATGEAPLLVLADDCATDPARTARAGRIISSDSLSDDAWRTFARGCDTVARAVRDRTGLRTVFHPHGACFVETPWEVDELMKRTDPALVGLCLDTGHLMLGGGDPLEIYRRHASRVWHVHFKDFDPRVFTLTRGRSWNYFESMRHGIFCELGRGAVDFAAMLHALREHGYDDWVVVEQDVLPGMGSPAESARRNRDFLRGLGV